MNNKFFHVLMVLMFVSFLVAGFTNPSDKNPKATKSGITNINTDNHINNQPPPSPNTLNLFTDNFDGPNDTTSLKSRGYKVWYRGTGPQGTFATWFQGDGTIFPAYNGPSTGYVAANYGVVTGTNNIDSWLVLPYQPGGYIVGDSISFWTRTESASIWPDSVTVSYSAAGDSIPEGSWVLLGKLLVPTSGWTNFSFAVPTTSPTGRLAVRYKVAGGGPTGNNSDYIGIDLLTTSRSTVGITPISSGVPKNYSLSQNYPNPFNPSTKLNFGIPKSGDTKITVYDVLGNEVAVALNEYVPAGNYSINFNASNLSSGVYFYRLVSGDFSQTMKMTLIK